MPGTDAQASRSSLVQQLIVAGWLCLGGQIGFILFQLERARSVDGTRFASAWDQRVEVLSFIVLPPNIPVIAPAAVVAIVATFLAGRDRSPWLVTLLRFVAGISITMAAIAVASIAEITTREGAVDLDAIFLRLGGASLVAGIAYACRIADVSTEWSGQSPSSAERK